MIHMLAGLSKADWTLGAIDRVAVRRRLCQDFVEHLFVTKVGMSPKVAKHLAERWFSKQYRHGLHHRVEEYHAAFSANKGTE